jgi:hypothetical protein
VFETIILLTEEAERDTLAALLRAQNPALAILAPRSKAELLALPEATLARARIVGFLTPIVVPPNVLAALGYGAYNVHPGPPSYPGWLPSHFAVYDRAAFFGATAHAMAAEVDAGPIVDVELFAVPPGSGVTELERLAFVQCVRLVWRLAPALARDPAPLPALPLQWSGRRSTKAAVRAACDIPADIAKDELERRLAAFGAGLSGSVPTVTLHGHTFRYVPPAAVPGTEAPPLVPQAQAEKQIVGA